MNLGRKYPQNIYLLRYEDLCLNPYETVDKLLNFLNYKPIPELIDHYITSHFGKTPSGQEIEIPKTRHEDPLSSVKNSAQKVFEWKTTIRKGLQQEIEENCEKSMNILGYTMGVQEGDQTLVKSASEVWPFS